jgi:hypothetical protein
MHRSPARVARDVSGRCGDTAAFDAELGNGPCRGVDAAAAAAADPITDPAPPRLQFLLEEADSGPSSGWGCRCRTKTVPRRLLRGRSQVSLSETVTGYSSEGYPDRLEPVERVFRLAPA